MPPKKKTPRVGPGRATVPVTVRLAPDVWERLQRAMLDRKIQNVEPQKQQEIVTAALSVWLDKNGY